MQFSSAGVGLRVVLCQTFIWWGFMMLWVGCKTQNTPYPHSLQSASSGSSPDSYLTPSAKKLSMPSGVWIANSRHKEWHVSAENITRAVNQALQLGVNAVYPVIWDKNRVSFDSQTAKQEKMFIIDDHIYDKGRHHDPLSYIIAVAKSHKLRVFPSLQSGLRIPLSSEASGKKTIIGATVSSRKNWLSVGRQGEILHDCHYGVCFGYFNILNPEVNEFLVRLTAEMLTNYEVDGVIFDDHFSMPAALVGCEPMVKQDPVVSIQFAQWQQNESKSTSWTQEESCIEFSNTLRRRAIVDFFAKIHTIASAHGKQLILSPAGTPDWSKRNWLQDWETIAKEGHVDGIILQAYRKSNDSFRAMLNSAELNFIKHPSSSVAFGVAILLGLRSRHVDFTGELISHQTTIAINAGVTPSYYYHEMVDIPTQGNSKGSRLAWIKSIKHQLTKHFTTTISAVP